MTTILLILALLCFVGTICFSMSGYVATGTTLFLFTAVFMVTGMMNFSVNHSDALDRFRADCDKLNGVSVETTDGLECFERGYQTIYVPRP